MMAVAAPALTPASASAASACPPPDRLLAFASGSLGEDLQASVEAHIDSCSDCRAALSSAARGDTPPTFGRYRIDTVLGSGGMGIVYRAWDPQLERAIAIKVVKRATDDALGRARLVREAQSLARLSHPNVCHVYDVGSEGDEVWVAMELIDGVSLRDWAAAHPRKAMDVLLGAAEGIAAAHAAGLVHRDVKPENVLVTRDGRAIVTDFGLARSDVIVNPNAETVTGASDPKLTATGAIVGTPAYLAPEQLTGERVDERVDQFAWAVMAWELIAGSRPFPIVFALRVDAVRAGVTPPAAMDKRVAQVLIKAMQVVARDRYATMREVIAAMTAAAAPEPAQETKKKQKRSLVPIAGAVAAIAVGGAAVAVWAKSDRTQDPAPATQAQAIAAAPTVTPIAQPPPTSPPAPPPATAAITQPIASGSNTSSPPVAARHTPAKTTVAVAARASTPAPAAAPTPVTAPPLPSPPLPSPPSSSSQNLSPGDRQQVVTPLYAPPTRPYRRDAAIASLDSFCYIAYDPAKADVKRGAVVDWGKVTSVDVERGQIAGEQIAEPIITIAGVRATYRIREDLGAVGTLAPKVGDELAVCGDREPSNTYQFTGGATWPMTAVVPLHGPPPSALLAKYKPIHTRDLALAADGARGTISLAADRNYLVRTRMKSRDGDRFQMDRWTLAVPPGLRGTDAIASGQMVWLIVDHPELASAPDGGRPKVVLHAVAVLPELFP